MPEGEELHKYYLLLPSTVGKCMCGLDTKYKPISDVFSLGHN